MTSEGLLFMATHASKCIDTGRGGLVIQVWVIKDTLLGSVEPLTTLHWWSTGG
jgi:hypothetical protein